MKLPTYDEACAAVEDRAPTPLAVFIYSHEPTFNNKSFRADLQKLVDYLIDRTQDGTLDA